MTGKKGELLPRQAMQQLLDLLYPPRCAGCQPHHSHRPLGFVSARWSSILERAPLLTAQRPATSRPRSWICCDT